MIAATPVAWLVLLPVLLLTGTALLVMVTDLWMEGPDRDGLGWLGIVGLAVTAVASITLWNQGETGFGGMMSVDRYALFFNLIFCLAAGLTLLMSMSYLELTDIRVGDYYTLILFATVGMMVMAAATDLIVIFLGLEVMSIAVYVLAGIWRRQLRSTEAALKYFLLGAFATGFLLFGIAMLYGATGSTTLNVIAGHLAKAGGEQRMLATIGMALLLIGFGFKVAAVPFHAWTPDVYEGAPTSITALMAVGVKAAAFAAFTRVFLHGLAGLSGDWSVVLWGLAVLTMTVGNVVAVLQQNIKRMLAYSSIAHAGYLLVGMVANGENGGSAVLFYLLGYALMNLGAFAVVMALGKRGEPNERLEDYAGVGFRHPFLGFAMAIFMLSLAGVPPLVGFAGKFYLFAAAVKSGYIGLAVIGVLNSVVSMYYYVGVLVQMYMTEGSADVPSPTTRPYLLATMLVTVIATILLGVFPSGAYEFARQAFLSLG
ncbi:MAG: NADH-quinone oxidoreductase subunit N [Deltaproteobacteria bacterium]|nr:NADH-quinone oxidoreductase subunit N [Deltaproteobacteria bacterium]MBI3386810.1 NADH-quinone oxidoreductase subunit N [Deltaproteobacteria bacterium]